MTEPKKRETAYLKNLQRTEPQKQEAQPSSMKSQMSGVNEDQSGTTSNADLNLMRNRFKSTKHMKARAQWTVNIGQPKASNTRPMMSRLNSLATTKENTQKPLTYREQNEADHELIDINNSQRSRHISSLSPPSSFRHSRKEPNFHNMK